MGKRKLAEIFKYNPNSFLPLRICAALGARKSTREALPLKEINELESSAPELPTEGAIQFQQGQEEPGANSNHSYLFIKAVPLIGKLGGCCQGTLLKLARALYL